MSTQKLQLGCIDCYCYLLAFELAAVSPAWYNCITVTGGFATYYNKAFLDRNNTQIQVLNRHLDDLLVVVGFVIIIIINTALLIRYFVSKKHFYIQKNSLNPFRKIYRVLKYAWKHKVPKRRSAFTYWEEDIPPRIDLGKDKYGGPFTTEEVENANTFYHSSCVCI